MDEKVILLVDDDRIIREAVKDFVDYLLSGRKIKIVEAGNGREAKDLLEAGLRPNLVLTDYRMPELNGIELVDFVHGKNELREVPIIIMSSDMFIEELAEKRGCMFFDKPGSFADLCSVIEEKLQ